MIKFYTDEFLFEYPYAIIPERKVVEIYVPMYCHLTVNNMAIHYPDLLLFLFNKGYYPRKVYVEEDRLLRVWYNEREAWIPLDS